MDLTPWLYALGAVALLVGMAGLVLPGIPGSLLLVAGVVLVAWAGDFQRIGTLGIAVAVVVGLVITAVDYLAGLLGAKAFGASRWAMIGGAVGAVVGLFFGLPGIVLGPAIGVVALEYAKNPDAKQAAKSGAGVFVGFLVGSALKVALGFFLVGVVVLDLFLNPGAPR